MLERRQENSWLHIQLHHTGNNGHHKGAGLNGDAKPVPLANGTNGAANGMNGGTNGMNGAANGINGTQKGANGDLSLEACNRGPNQPFPPIGRPELKLASPFFLKPR